MKSVSNFRKNGFTLIELLVVMAIIAMLAAIIFPVMAQVKEGTDRSSCMQNLKQIGNAMAMYYADNKRYPTGLAPDVEFDSDGNPKGINAVKGNLYASDYLPSVDVLHCPSDDRFEDKKEIVTVDSKDIYAYSSYEVYINDASKSEFVGTDNIVRYTAESLPIKQYSIDWSDDELTSGEGNYARQLKWKNPPSDTVIAWCVNHAEHPYAASGSGYSAEGKGLVLFLDGHVGLYNDVTEVSANRWKIRPNIK